MNFLNLEERPGDAHRDRVSQPRRLDLKIAKMASDLFDIEEK